MQRSPADARPLVAASVLALILVLVAMAVPGQAGTPPATVTAPEDPATPADTREAGFRQAQALLDHPSTVSRSGEIPVDGPSIGHHRQRLSVAEQVLGTLASEEVRAGEVVQAASRAHALQTQGPAPRAASATPLEPLLERLLGDQPATSPEDRAALRGLADLDPGLRAALTGVVDAFLAFDRTTRQALALDEAPRLSPTRDEAVAPAEASLGSRSFDPAPVLATRDRLLTAVGDLQPAADDPATTDVTVDLCPALALDLAGQDSVYEDPCALVVDLGGDDVYRNNAGGSNLDGECAAVTGRTPGAAALVSLGHGDDRYGDAEDPLSCGANGGGASGAGLLFDDGGDDTYVAGAFGTNGGARNGLGLLVDEGGSDTYRVAGGRTSGGANGGAAFDGYGGLVDLDGNDTYEARSQGTNGGADLGSSGFLVDAGGDDVYVAGRTATNGGANLSSHGMLVDAGGDDRYLAAGGGTNGGGGTGGSGLLVDASGDDVYEAGREGANGGGSGGVGTLLDLEGDDRYTAGRRANGAGVSGVGLLLDGNGTDRYRDPILRGGYCEDCSAVPKGSAGTQLDSDEVPRGSSLASCGQRPVHPPIHVSGDDGPLGFTVTVAGEERVRPGSGVRDGNGSAADPFVIEGWCIPTAQPAVGGDPVPAIWLEGTRAHVVIRDVLVVGGGPGEVAGHGVRMEQVANASLVDNRIRQTVRGVDLQGVEDIDVRGNEVVRGIAGLWLVDTSDVAIVENHVRRNAMVAVSLESTERTLVADNRLDVNADGIVGLHTVGTDVTGNSVIDALRRGMNFLESEDLTVEHNDVAAAGTVGVTAWRVDSASIENNTVRQSPEAGIVWNRGHALSIANNTIRDNGEEGIGLGDVGDVRVRDNEVGRNEVGVTVEESATDVVLRGNNLVDNRGGVGLRAAGAPVDARQNWWGCPQGPDDPACDDAEGPALVDPWLMEPNLAAGAEG